jgi:OOP family OmpA-OmpF porin
MKHGAWFLAAAVLCAVSAFPSIAAAQQCVVISLYFSWGSAELDKESGYPLLGMVWEKSQPEGRIALDGHTDATEPAELGQQRAQAVADLLTGAGMAADRISVRGSGFTRPAVNVTSADAQNRRVEACVSR